MPARCCRKYNPRPANWKLLNGYGCRPLCAVVEIFELDHNKPVRIGFISANEPDVVVQGVLAAKHFIRPSNSIVCRVRLSGVLQNALIVGAWNFVEHVHQVL